MNDLLRAIEHYKKISRLEGVQGLLWWDMETMMPQASASERGEQLGVIAGLLHGLWSDPRFYESIESAYENLTDFSNELARRQIEKLRRELARRRALDEDFVVRESRMQAQCQNQWKEAKGREDFSLVEKSLAELVSLAREKASRLKQSKELAERFAGLDAYSILFDALEPGFKSSELSRLFSKLEAGLSERLPKILERQAKNFPDMAMSIDEQKRLLRTIPIKLGLQSATSRLDESAHPFCGGARGDVRITTAYDATDYSDGLFSVIHESGHGLYEQAIPHEYWHTPVGQAASYGIHESQSRFYENQIGRSTPFCRWLGRELAKDSNDLERSFRRVQKGFVRVAADEVTYNFHVLLRWRLETKLINGGLEVKDLSAAWREEFSKLMGFPVDKESNGCLQDIHWYGGAFAYFPTYSIGNLLAAELYRDFKLAHVDWQSRVESGDFHFIHEFMNKRIHHQASLKDSPETIHFALGGRNLGVDAFFEYLDERYI